MAHDNAPTLEYYRPPQQARPVERSLTDVLLERRKWVAIVCLVVYIWCGLVPFALLLRRPNVGVLVFVLAFAARIALLVGGLTLPPPSTTGWTANWLSRRVKALRIGRCILWSWLIASGAWLWWLHINNAPVRMWWHPWFDLAPALQLFLLGLLILLALVTADLADGLYRWWRLRRQLSADGNGLSLQA